MNRAARRRGETPAEPPSGPLVGRAYAPLAMLGSAVSVPLALGLAWAFPWREVQSVVLVVACLPGAWLAHAWASQNRYPAPRAVLGFYLGNLVLAAAALRYLDFLRADVPALLAVGYPVFCVAAVWLVHRAVGRWVAGRG